MEKLFSNRMTLQSHGMVIINGELVQTGTYVWKIQFRNLLNDQNNVEYGTVTVLK